MKTFAPKNKSAFEYLLVINLETFKLKKSLIVSIPFFLASCETFLEGSTPITPALENLLIAFKKVPSLLPASTTKLFESNLIFLDNFCAMEVK